MRKKEVAPDLTASLVLLARHYCFSVEHKQFSKTRYQSSLLCNWVGSRQKRDPSILRSEQNTNLVQIRKRIKHSLILVYRSNCLNSLPSTVFFPTPPLLPSHPWLWLFCFPLTRILVITWDPPG